MAPARIAVFLAVCAVLACAHAWDIITVAGTGTRGGEACHLPFTVGGETFWGCTYTIHNKAWCSTTGNENEWGECPDDAPGVIPAALLTLTINDTDPSLMPPYNRAEWPHWSTKDCRTTRNWALIAQSYVPVTFTTDTECSVASGLWYDFYTGDTTTVPRDFDIDHLVPLENAHISGGWAWSRDQKRDFANYLLYPMHLLAVGASINRQKGSMPPDQWMPPMQSFLCEYAVRWITVKGTWGLTVTTAEAAALKEALNLCPHAVRWDTKLGAVLNRTGPYHPAATEPVSDSSNLTATLIGVLCAFLLIAVMIALAYYLRRRRQQQHAERAPLLSVYAAPPSTVTAV